MNLKVLILTNQTTHHAFFIKNLLEADVNVQVILEEKGGSKSSGSFFQEMQAYEKDIFFAGENQYIDKMVQSKQVSDINSQNTLDYLSKNQFDICYSFGVGLLKENTLSKLPSMRLNLHGGNIQNYRGLDSHIWSCYHKDLHGFLTTLHILSKNLDCGNIVQIGELDLSEISEMYMIRSLNTRMAIDLVLANLHAFNKLGSIISYSQTTKGRYYSRMPESLYEKSARNFHILKNS